MFTMKKEKWNPEDWQGRSRKQIESTNTIMYYTMIGLCIAIVVAYIFKFIG
jgi:uncharacterized membrane protein YidH (DUF202 family)